MSAFRRNLMDVGLITYQMLAEMNGLVVKQVKFCSVVHSVSSFFHSIHCLCCEHTAYYEGKLRGLLLLGSYFFLCLNCLNSKKGDKFFQFYMPDNVSEFILNSVLFIPMCQLLRNHPNVKILFLHYSLLLTNEALMVYYAILH